jgi:hypothetical protein
MKLYYKTRDVCYVKKVLVNVHNYTVTLNLYNLVNVLPGPKISGINKPSCGAVVCWNRF